MSVTVALVAASAGILSPIVTYWVSLRAGKTQGADLGQVTAAASLGQAVGSVLGGLLFNLAILPSAGFVTAALIVAAGFVASVGLSRLLWQPSPALVPARPAPQADLAAEAIIEARRHPHEHSG
jgi:predicted MFS family arabinose efflux permease